MTAYIHQLSELQQVKDLSLSLLAIHLITPDLSAETGMQALSIHQTLDVIQEARSLGLEGIQFCGSATFLHPAFDVLFETLRTSDETLIFETNGAGLTAQRAAQLADRPRCQVVIRLDEMDPNEAYGNFLVSAAYQTAVAAARLAAEAGLHPQMTLPLLRPFIPYIPGFLREAEASGVETIRLLLGPDPSSLPRKTRSEKTSENAARFMNLAEAEDPAEAYLQQAIASPLTVEELIALGRKIDRDVNPRTRLHLLFDQPPAFRGLHPMSQAQEPDRAGLLNAITVLSTGEYTLWGVTERYPSLILGVVGIDSLKKIWSQHPLLELLRDGMPDRLEGICNRCIFKTMCRGFNAPENYLRTGSFWSPYWFCASAEQAGLFPAGRFQDYW